ncbi:MAG: catalase family protein [Segetibacter sp.]
MRDTQEIIDTVTERLKRDFLPGKTLRQFHAKMHGCVKATFTVLPEIPKNYQFGFLVPNKSYEAWIRFSNGSVTVVDDKKADLRGMSIKLLNVDGEMLVQDHWLPQSQDFLMVSYPILMSPKVAPVVRNVKAVCAGSKGMILFALNPINWMTLYRTLKGQKKTDNMFSLIYYSVSPFRLGKPEQAVKYGAFPASEGLGKPANKKDPNFLRHNMQQDLISKSVFYDFMVQFQEDAVKMPIEDVCVEWKSPWHKVAKIEIHPQHFDTSELNTFGENLTFSPWHCHKENQPLGGINRARKAAYEAIGKFRVERNTK